MTAPEQTNDPNGLTQSEPAPAPQGARNEDDAVSATREELARVARELRELSERVQREKAEQRALAEIGKVRWFDPAEAARELLPALCDESGVLYVADPGNANEKIPLAQAVAELAKRRPYWVKAELREGSGALGNARGASRTANAEPELTYQDLLEDPKRMADWLRRDPMEVARLRAKHGRTR
ncbi:MAG: hypothetical protein L6R28_01580 [Planctomycetes bacterium]|nr:hypothetical protein [Planctomycetota bacterium]